MARRFGYALASPASVATLCAGCAGATAPESAVRDVLQRQAACWNAGDLDGFMDGYWRSEGLTFSAGGQTIRGWEATLRRYRERYADREQMGSLSFSDLEVTTLGDAAALVLGRWRLARRQGPVGGNFTLVLRRFGEGWRIVHDHTSLEPPAASEKAVETGARNE